MDLGHSRRQYLATEMTTRRVDIEGKLYTIVDSEYSELSHAFYLAHSQDYCMTGEKEESEDPSVLSRAAGKVLYTYNAITDEVNRYNYMSGIGCVMCYMDTQRKWWTVAQRSYNGDLNTVFPKDSNMIAEINSLVSNDG